MKQIDLNADLGEGMAFDAELLNIVSSASVACGGHAGSAETMRQTLNAAKGRGVRTGAHPGFADPEHFGRRRLDIPVSEIWAQISVQIEALVAIADDVGQAVSYVKLHGALYNMAAENLALSRVLFESIKDRFGLLPIMALDGSAQVDAALEIGLPVIREAFADRRYTGSGLLMARSEPGAVLHATGQVAAQAIGIARDGVALAPDGKEVSLNAQSICLHGDNQAALEMARAVRAELEGAGIAIGTAV